VELGRACRGGLRDGNHAEFTLIERKLQDKNLNGATLYVTLEPCTRRKAPKKPCAEWIKSARIKRVFIGMTDPNPDICGRGVQYFLNNGIEVDFFDVDLVREIRDTNRDFIDYWENTPASAKAEPFEGPSRKELEVVSRSAINDLSLEALNRYVEARELHVKVPSSALWHLMEKAGYLGADARNKVKPTVAGLILFGTCPADILPQCRVEIEARKGGRTIHANFEGPLMHFRDHIDAFFRENMRHFTEIQEFERVRIGEYPLEAVRESLFNAVVHRDYESGARVHVCLGDTFLEVRSPGMLLRPPSSHAATASVF